MVTPSRSACRVVSTNAPLPVGESTGVPVFTRELGTGPSTTPRRGVPADTVAERGGSVGLDKPIYTISIAAEILETHPRTLMMYESLGLLVPHRTPTNRRRYTQRDVLTLQAVQRLTRQHGLNLNGARYVIQCLRLLDKHHITRPTALKDIDIAHVEL